MREENIAKYFFFLWLFIVAFRNNITSYKTLHPYKLNIQSRSIQRRSILSILLYLINPMINEIIYREKKFFSFFPPSFKTKHLL